MPIFYFKRFAETAANVHKSILIAGENQDGLEWLLLRIILKFSIKLLRRG
jgi:hypothetical protein